MYSEPGEGQSSIPGHRQARDIAQGSKHLLLIRWLGQRSLTFHRWFYNSKRLFLKGDPGKAKQDFVAGILSAGPYLNVQALGVSRAVTL